MFGKSKKSSKKKEVVQPCISDEFSKAKDVAFKYDQLKNCCDVLSGIQPREKNLNRMLISSYSEGWRVWKHTVTSAGIDIEEVYQYIEKLAMKRKLELEIELSKV